MFCSGWGLVHADFTLPHYTFAINYIQEWACPTLKACLLSNIHSRLCAQHTVGLAEHGLGCFIAGNPTWSKVFTQLRVFLLPFQKLSTPGCPECLSETCWSSNMYGFVIVFSDSLWFVALSNCLYNILESEWIYLRVGCNFLHLWKLFVFIGRRRYLDVTFPCSQQYH